MLGAFIGDIVGSVYEFNNTKDYKFKLFTKDSSFTDDSIMTAAVAEWVMHDKILSHGALEKIMVSFASDFSHPVGGYGTMFKLWLFGHDGLNIKRCPYNSWGNGSAMRVSSIGWLFRTLEMTVKVAEISASITHNHPEGIKGATATAAAIYLARTGHSKKEIKSYIEEVYGYDLGISWTDLHKHYSWDSSCQGTVPQAIICFLKSDNFESAIRNAVSIGGDSDTLACITGSIAEAFYGDIPEWIVDKALEILPIRILQVLREFCRNSNYSIFLNRYGKTMSDLMKFTPDKIVKLKHNEIFVFGSNIEGKHFGGAARLAYEKFGATWGAGEGRTGQCFAIPTMQGGVETIKPYVDDFIRYATVHPEYIFYVTKIGCGIAGFREDEIAPLFAEAISVQNIILPRSFYELIVSQ